MSEVQNRREPVLGVPAIFAIAGLFGLLYAYVIWNAVALLVAQASGDLGINALGWGILLAAVAFPAAVFAGAFALGWRRSALELTVVLLAGLALVAVFWLNVLAYAYAYGASLLGG